MDIILLIIACFYIKDVVKKKGLAPKEWVWKLIGFWLLFEITGGLLSLAITGGNLVMASVFGFVSGIGGFLVIKSRLDKIPTQTNKGTDTNDPDVNNNWP